MEPVMVVQKVVADQIGRVQEDLVVVELMVVVGRQD